MYILIVFESNPILANVQLFPKLGSTPSYVQHIITLLKYCPIWE